MPTSQPREPLSANWYEVTQVVVVQLQLAACYSACVCPTYVLEYDEFGLPYWDPTCPAGYTPCDTESYCGVGGDCSGWDQLGCEQPADPPFTSTKHLCFPTAADVMNACYQAWLDGTTGDCSDWTVTGSRFESCSEGVSLQPGYEIDYDRCITSHASADDCGGCWTCPLGYTYDPVSRLCLSSPCSPGTCYCDLTGECISCTDPDCKEELNCSWNPTTCGWDCDEPSCGETEYWNSFTCACTACPTGRCECAGVPCAGDCTEPACKTQLNCTWNSVTCEWDCDTPSCPGGEHWDEHVCRCVPDCPDGEEWCEGTSSCTSTTPPDCATALGCVWDADACAWDCEDSATVCAAGATWNAAACACEGLISEPFNLETRLAQYHAAWNENSRIRYRRATYAVPPYETDVTATNPGTAAADQDGEPCFVEDPAGQRMVMLFTRKSSGVSRIWETESYDDGETWTGPTTVFASGSHPVVAVGIDGEIIRAAYVSGRIRGTIQEPGESSPGDEFVFSTASAELAVEDDRFHLAPAPEHTKRWLLVCRLQSSPNEVTSLYSTDECQTWTVI